MPGLIWSPVTPPANEAVFNNITVVQISPSEVDIEWDVSPPATGQVEYGPTTAYGSVTILETNYLDFHRQGIAGLDPEIVYHFRIKGTTVDGVTTYSPDGTFMTESDTVPPPIPGSAIDLAYGTCGFNTLSNLRLWPGSGGGTPLAASYRFRAPFTKYLRSMRWYEVHDEGYGAGTGGIIQITLRADNPSSSTMEGPGSMPSGTHYWTGSALSSCPNFIPNMSTDGDAAVVSTFTTPYQVVAGTLYHIVFRNIDADPVANHISPDVNAGLSFGTHPRWGVGCIDFGVTFDDTEGGVCQRPGHLPLMDLSFSDTPSGAISAHYGDGHMQVEAAMTISGNTQVRERITVSERERVVDGVYAYLERVSGSSPLVVYLETSAGVVIDQATFPYTDFQTGNGLRGNTTNPVWVFRPFAADRTLALNTTYNLRFATAAGTTYMMEGYQKGVNYGYHASTVFPDGIFQQTSGGAGGSWSTLGNEDGHFYLRYAS